MAIIGRAVALGCAAFAIAACSGSTNSTGGASGTASVNGTIGGQAVQTANVVAVVGSETTNGATVQLDSIVITSVSDACAYLQNPTHHFPSASTLVLAAGAIAPSVPTGTFPIGQYGYAQYDADSATCVLTTSETASGGSIVLTSVSSDSIDGTFDVTMPNGDHLSGSFDAPVCSGVSYQQIQNAQTANLPCSQ
ncbi:MAG TPA: hypothetical protein VMI75_38870 [Polyangiaceae bacterium]|nr:hypothetical protein [Polyangiaceae bacterium]